MDWMDDAWDNNKGIVFRCPHQWVLNKCAITKDLNDRDSVPPSLAIISIPLPLSSIEDDEDVSSEQQQAKYRFAFSYLIPINLFTRLFPLLLPLVRNWKLSFAEFVQRTSCDSLYSQVYTTVVVLHTGVVVVLVSCAHPPRVSSIVSHRIASLSSSSSSSLWHCVVNYKLSELSSRDLPLILEILWSCACCCAGSSRYL